MAGGTLTQNTIQNLLKDASITGMHRHVWHIRWHNLMGPLPNRQSLSKMSSCRTWLINVKHFKFLHLHIFYSICSNKNTKLGVVWVCQSSKHGSCLVQIPSISFDGVCVVQRACTCNSPQSAGLELLELPGSLCYPRSPSVKLVREYKTQMPRLKLGQGQRYNSHYNAPL